MTAQHTATERNDSNQKNDDEMSKITFMGSWATVKVNIARAGPNVMRAQPQNSNTVIIYGQVVEIIIEGYHL